MRHWIAKEVDGRVVDVESHSPLAAVAIYRIIDGKRILVGKSDAEGRFYVPAQRAVSFEVPMGDPLYSSSLLFIRDGYSDSSAGSGTFAGEVYSSEPPMLNSMIVEMKKKPNQAPEPTAPSGRGSS